MAQHRKCRWQGLGYLSKSGVVKCICDKTGETHFQSYCFKKCDDYEPMKKKEGKYNDR